MFILYMSTVTVWVICGFVSYGYHYAYTIQPYVNEKTSAFNKSSMNISLAASWFYCYITGPMGLIQVFRKSLNTRGWYRWLKTEDKQ